MNLEYYTVLKRNLWTDRFCFQQDSAPLHESKLTVAFSCHQINGLLHLRTQPTRLLYLGLYTGQIKKIRNVEEFKSKGEDV